jgi:hypothetical protein
MTKQEFIQQKKLFEKRFEQHDIFYAIAFVVVLLLNWLFVSQFSSFVESWIVLYLLALCSIFIHVYPLDKKSTTTCDQ